MSPEEERAEIEYRRAKLGRRLRVLDLAAASFGIGLLVMAPAFWARVLGWLLGVALVVLLLWRKGAP